MAKKMPIGTIRHWEKGDVIKACEGNRCHSGWIALETNPALVSIGHECDSKGNQMIKEKIPINGELFLDHEILNFEMDEDSGKGPFNPENFKQYQGFYGAGRYSFTNEFSKRFMADKIALQQAISDAYESANDAKGGNKVKKDILTAEEKKDIKNKVKKNFNYNIEPFTVETAEKLRGIVARTYDQLKVGTNFKTKKETDSYANAIKVAENLPLNYERLKIKRQLKDDTLKDINITFSDNWGIRESVKRLIDEKYGEYVRKFSKRISDDEAADQEAVFGIKLDDDTKTFYKALFKKAKEDKDKLDKLDWDKYVGRQFEGDFGREYVIKKDENNDVYYMRKGLEGSEGYIEMLDDSDSTLNLIKTKILEEESKYPFKELIYLRFETLYGKQLDGNWTIDMLPVIYNIENLINKLPDGQFKTNKELNLITNKDYGSGQGYAYYSPDERRINFSDAAARASQIWGDLGGQSEFNSVCTHEVGHAVSYKLGRHGSLDYKKFVVSCGWSYQQMNIREHSTGNDKRIQREGSNSTSSLLTDYSHQSPEEAFAEYYSIYVNNKEAIDNYLATNNAEFLNKKSKLVVAEKKEEDLFSLGQFHSQYKIYDANFGTIENSIQNLNLNPENHIKLNLINPWSVKYGKQTELESKEIKSGLYYARQQTVKPIVVIKDKLNQYHILQGAYINQACKHTHKFVPAIEISRELYTHLNKNFTDTEIIDYCGYKLKNEKIPIQDSQPKFKKGLEYRNDILDQKDLVVNKERFQMMKRIYDSPSLKKALMDIFSLDRIRDIFTSETMLVDSDEDYHLIVKAKVEDLIEELSGVNREINLIKNEIDNE